MAAADRLTVSKYLATLVILFSLTIIITVVSILSGSTDISIGQLIDVIFGKSSNNISQIILDIRLPRIMLAIAAGGGLSVAGAVFQAILMNPLAEPYILGISSGGTFGAILSFLLGFSFIGTQIFSFAGSMIVIFIVFYVGKRFGEIEPNVLLLTGVMIGAFFSAAILLMMTMLSDSLRSAFLWLIGNLSSADSVSAFYVLPVTVIVSIFLSINSYKYNVLALGAENAKHLGINTNSLKNFTYILASFMVGAIVSVSGIIGFVGLLVPHVCRMIFGIDNRLVVPASFFIGAMYLIIADTFARTIVSPAELPVGAITAIIGAPVFIYLLRRRFNIIN
ncbi:MAG: iron ABC transporter permease [Bacteroidetes bacterium]|nr:iron ABC transporter permease [Bacteroidota bacterium]